MLKLLRYWTWKTVSSHLVRQFMLILWNSLWVCVHLNLLTLFDCLVVPWTEVKARIRDLEKCLFPWIEVFKKMTNCTWIWMYGCFPWIEVPLYVSEYFDYFWTVIFWVYLGFVYSFSCIVANFYANVLFWLAT